MRQQLEMARPHLAADQPNLVVLTELNGLPLVLLGLPLPSRLSFQQAAALLTLRHLSRVLPLMWREGVSPVRALQLARSAEHVALYLRVCQQLAREYGVYLCCGSLPMPRYHVQGKRLRREAATLHNETVLLSPKGELIGVTDKVHLTPAEEGDGVDLTPGPLGELRVFPTPVGDLGVGISLDAFRQDVIGRLEAQGCTVLLQPDANGLPWTAQEGLPPDPTQVRDQPLAWLESSHQATTQGQNIRYAVNPMVVGNLFDLSFDGQSAITGRAEDTDTLQSYVLTKPRAGFLRLMPWVAQGESAVLRRTGQELAARSGHPRENEYRTGVLSADLSLPPCRVAVPPQTPHEQALAAWLRGEAEIEPKRPPSALYWVLGLSVMAYLTWHASRRR